jgi:ATP-dependent RNA helicase DHX29
MLPQVLTVSQHERNRLPIAQYRTEIVEALEMSQVLVLSGETGW